MKLPLAGSPSLETRGCEKPTNHSCHTTQHQPQAGSQAAFGMPLSISLRRGGQQRGNQQRLTAS